MIFNHIIKILSLMMIRNATSWSEVCYIHAGFWVSVNGPSQQRRRAAHHCNISPSQSSSKSMFSPKWPQPCMCGLTHPNPVVKPFPNLSINHMDSLQLYLVMCQPSAVDYINAFYVRSQFRFKVTLHVSLSLRSHFCLSPRICNVTSISCCQYLTHY